MQIIAHRGASGVSPENTVFSITSAINSSANIIEIDVQLTKDDIVVLFHDRSFSRIDGDTNSIQDYTYEELREKDVGSHFNKEYANLQIPTLTDVLEQFQHIDFIIEIKPQKGTVDRHLEISVLDILKDYKYEFNKGYISVRDFETFSWFKDQEHDFPLGVMQKKRSDELFNKLCKKYKISIAQIRRNSYSRQSISNLQSIVDFISVYPADYPKSWQICIDWGINGILTNFPANLKSYLQLNNLL